MTASSWATSDTAIVVVASAVLIIAITAWLYLRLSRRTDKLVDLLEHNKHLLERVEDVWRFQHAQGTYVGTLQGLWRVLEEGLEQGGLSNDMRRSIYRAGDEMFAAFHERTRVWQEHEAQLLELDEPVLFARGDNPARTGDPAKT